jgi:rhodanese-related sulfurtransferase
MKSAKLFLAITFTIAASAFQAPTVHAQGFPTFFGSGVPEVSVDDLAKLVGDEQAMKKIVLVDVRSEAETSVSVIPGAITKTQYEAKADQYAGKKVIVYCTVGGRSGAYAKQLAAKKIDVVNFKGSILAWANAGQPFETLDREPTNRVHTYAPGNRIPATYEAVH